MLLLFLNTVTQSYRLLLLLLIQNGFCVFEQCLLFEKKGIENFVFLSSFEHRCLPTANTTAQTQTLKHTNLFGSLSTVQFFPVVWFWLYFSSLLFFFTFFHWLLFTKLRQVHVFFSAVLMPKKKKFERKWSIAPKRCS